MVKQFLNRTGSVRRDEMDPFEKERQTVVDDTALPDPFQLPDHFHDEMARVRN